MKESTKFIGWDLSGTGTTAYFTGTKIGCIKSKKWEDHVEFIKTIMKKNYGKVVCFEKITKIRRNNSTSKDLVMLSMVNGFMEMSYKRTYQVQSSITKSIKDKLLSGQKSFKNLEYRRGRANGWFYKNERITEHEVDAMIIYYYSRGKNTGEYF